MSVNEEQAERIVEIAQKIVQGGPGVCLLVHLAMSHAIEEAGEGETVQDIALALPIVLHQLEVLVDSGLWPTQEHWFGLANAIRKAGEKVVLQ